MTESWCHFPALLHLLLVESLPTTTLAIAVHSMCAKHEMNMRINRWNYLSVHTERSHGKIWPDRDAAGDCTQRYRCVRESLSHIITKPHRLAKGLPYNCSNGLMINDVSGYGGLIMPVYLPIIFALWLYPILAFLCEFGRGSFCLSYADGRYLSFTWDLEQRTTYTMLTFITGVIGVTGFIGLMMWALHVFPPTTVLSALRDSFFPVATFFICLYKLTIIHPPSFSYDSSSLRALRFRRGRKYFWGNDYFGLQLDRAVLQATFGDPSNLENIVDADKVQTLLDIYKGNVRTAPSFVQRVRTASSVLRSEVGSTVGSTRRSLRRSDVGSSRRAVTFPSERRGRTTTELSAKSRLSADLWSSANSLTELPDHWK